MSFNKRVLNASWHSHFERPCHREKRVQASIRNELQGLEYARQALREHCIKYRPVSGGATSRLCRYAAGLQPAADSQPAAGADDGAGVVDCILAQRGADAVGRTAAGLQVLHDDVGSGCDGVGVADGEIE